MAENEKFEFKHWSVDQTERLTIKKGDALLFEREYKNGGAIIGLLYIDVIAILSESQKQYIKDYLEKYIEYKRTGDFYKISPMLIQASSQKPHLGRIIASPYTETSITTSDTDVLVRYMILRLDKANAMIQKCVSCGKFFVPVRGSIADTCGCKGAEDNDAI